ncbi:MAG TPA: hypothetical protein VF137_03320 [Candidatus Dormibacteraeota bacterium]
MKGKVRVSVALPADVRERLANEAAARGQSLDAALRQRLLESRPGPGAEQQEELARAKAEASARARELGEARRRIRDLEVRLNSLLAAPLEIDGLPVWSLESSRRSPEDREQWWRWLALGVEKLRARYGVVGTHFEARDRHRHSSYWWESPGRVRAIAIAVRWEEMLDQGGPAIPGDPRFGEGFLDFLWRISHQDRAAEEVGRLFQDWEDEKFDDRRAGERAAFEKHLAVELKGSVEQGGGVTSGAEDKQQSAALQGDDAADWTVPSDEIRLNA